MKRRVDTDWTIWLAFWGAVLLLLAVSIAAGIDSAKHRSQFMRECRQDHKQYECESMYGSSRSY